MVRMSGKCKEKEKKKVFVGLYRFVVLKRGERLYGSHEHVSP